MLPGTILIYNDELEPIIIEKGYPYNDFVFEVEPPKYFANIFRKYEWGGNFKSNMKIKLWNKLKTLQKVILFKEKLKTKAWHKSSVWWIYRDNK